MSYKTILVHIDDTNRNADQVQLAGKLAIQFDAHLMGIADTGVARFIYSDVNMNGVDPGLLTHLEMLRDRMAQKAEAFKQQAQSMALRSVNVSIANDAPGGIAAYARYCDLVVLGQNNPDEPSPTVTDDFPEYMILNSGRPVLIVPYAGQFNHISQRPLIGWDGSRAATRAITDAIPLLQGAGLVNIAMFNPDSEKHGAESGAGLSAYLARHGIQSAVSVQRTKLDIGNALLSLAADLDSDLLVMGGYGHSRLREMIMGGVTRSILERMTLPVFMSH